LAVSDATLVLRVLDGEEEAFGELYDRYVKLVRAICHDSTRDVNTAADLAQEVFLRVHHKLAFLENPERFGPWLVSIARNVGREYRRGKARDRHFLVGLEPPEVTVDKSEADRDDRLDGLKVAMDSLAEKERLVLHVHYLRDQKDQQGPELLGLSRSSYYRLVERAKQKIAKHIELNEK
jgi:RNA polymerase sigma-70 factor (ECF subfamily)